MFGGHYNKELKLIRDEFKSLLKFFLIYIVIGVALVYAIFRLMIPIITIVQLAIICLQVNCILRIAMKKNIVRKTLINVTEEKVYEIGRIFTNIRIAITNITGYIKTENHLFKTYLSVYNYDKLDNENIEQVIIAIEDSSKENINLIFRKIYNKLKVVKMSFQ
jgi:lysyl-tRNA synthetase class II